MACGILHPLPWATDDCTVILECVAILVAAKLWHSPSHVVSHLDQCKDISSGCEVHLLPFLDAKMCEGWQATPLVLIKYHLNRQNHIV